MKQENIKKIDVKELIHSKNPTLAKLLPWFVMRYIRRIIHEDEINAIFKKYGNKTGLEFAQAGIDDFKVKVIVKGGENIPKSGRYIFAANHPLGGFDGLLLLNTLSKYFDDVKFLVNDILMNVEQLRSHFIPINKHGSHSKENASLIEKTYAGKGQVLTFPAGLVSRKIKGKITDLEWKKSFIAKAVRYERDVIPVHISGANSRFFYNLSNLRKSLGIKNNIEMFYLVDETFKHRNKTVTLTFGRPIPWKTFDKSKNYREWAYYIRQQVYKLPE